MISVFTDGGSRGNPGPSALGVYIENELKEELISFGRKVGITTNNVAEYKAVVAALDWLLEQKELVKEEKKIYFYMDSLLVCSQLNRLYKIKNPALKELFMQIMEREARLGIPVMYAHIRRELNKKADFMVNKALDGE